MAMESLVLMLSACKQKSYRPTQSTRGAHSEHTHLNVLVLPWYGLDHLLNGTRQVFSIFFDGKFGVPEAQHAATACSDVEQTALFRALNLKLQIFLGALLNCMRLQRKEKKRGGAAGCAHQSQLAASFFEKKQSQ